VIHADILHNNWYQRLKAAGKRLIAVQGESLLGVAGQLEAGGAASSGAAARIVN